MKKIVYLFVCFLLVVNTVFAQSVTTLTDINNHKYQTAIEYLFNEGIISGYPNMTFKPNTSINRAELTKTIVESNYDTVLINQYANTSCFPDVNTSDWFSKYVCFAKSKNIVSGYPDGTFLPANTVNLVEALKIIYEGLNIPINNENVVFKFKYYSPAMLAGYLPEDLRGGYAKLLTRGEVSEVLYRILTDENRIIESDVSLGLTVFKQKYQSSCGIAALATALSLGTSVTEDQIIQQMTAMGLYPNNPVRNENGKYYWDDPQQVFVGDYDGLVSIYMSRLTGFGFLEGPLEKLAKVYAADSEKFSNKSLSYLAEQIDLGNPVIVFANVNARNGAVVISEPGPYNVSWTFNNTMQEISVPMYKHNLVIDGYRGTPEKPAVFYIIDPFYGNKIELSSTQLSALLAGYDYSGVVVKF